MLKHLQRIIPTMNFEPAPLQPTPAPTPFPMAGGEDLLPQPPETAPTQDPRRKIVPEPKEIMYGLRLGIAITNSLAVFPALFGQAMLVWLLVLVVGNSFGGGGPRSTNPEVLLGSAVILLAIGYSILGYWFLFGYWFFPRRSSHRRMARFWWGSTVYNAILTGIYGIYCGLVMYQSSRYMGSAEMLGFLPFSLTAAMTCVSIAFARAHGGAHRHEMEIMALARTIPEDQYRARMEALALRINPPRA